MNESIQRMRIAREKKMNKKALIKEHLARALTHTISQLIYTLDGYGMFEEKEWRDLTIGTRSIQSYDTNKAK